MLGYTVVTERIVKFSNKPFQLKFNCENITSLKACFKKDHTNHITILNCVNRAQQVCGAAQHKTSRKA